MVNVVDLRSLTQLNNSLLGCVNCFLDKSLLNGKAQRVAGKGAKLTWWLKHHKWYSQGSILDLSCLISFINDLDEEIIGCTLSKFAKWEC